jgi:small subunit ribosomal protein S2e
MSSATRVRTSDLYPTRLPSTNKTRADHQLPVLRTDEVMKIMPVQKQTRAGQRTRFKAFVAIGDFDGHVGLGVKCAKEVATAIRGAIILAKLSVIPVRRGYWGAKLGEPHTVPCKVNGKVGSVFVALVPAPRGTGIVAAPASKRMLQLAGVEDVYTQSRGFVLAPFLAVSRSLLAPQLTPYGHVGTPQLWATSERPFSSLESHFDPILTLSSAHSQSHLRRHHADLRLPVSALDNVSPLRLISTTSPFPLRPVSSLC